VSLLSISARVVSLRHLFSAGHSPFLLKHHYHWAPPPPYFSCISISTSFTSMALFSWSTIIVMATTMAVLTAWIREPASYANVAALNVHTTLLASLAGGSAVNVACAAVTRAVRAVPPGDELGACTPYGLMGGGIAARLHMHWIDGYVHGEWAYIRQTPARVEAYGREARGLVEAELTRLGLIKSGAEAEASAKSEL
jgi:hypothetical protein